MVAAAVGVGTAVAGVAGSAMSSKAAGKAANAQSEAADEANAIAREQYEQNTKNMQPYMDAGLNGLNALQNYMGLGNGLGGRTLSEQEIRDELRGQYTTAASSGRPPTVDEALASSGMRGAAARNYSNATWAYDPQAQRWGYKLDYIDGGDAGGTSSKWAYSDPIGATSEKVDEAGLNAAIQKRLQEQADAIAAAKGGSAGGSPTGGGSAASGAPGSGSSFGSLLKEYEAYKPYAEYTPYQAYTPYKEYVPFSDAEFKADPGYQFRLDQGNKAIQNLAAATGNLNSGRALKDAMNFSSGLASQEYQNAYGRYNNDYNTGLNSHLQNYETGLNSHVENYLTGLNSHMQNYLTGFNTNETNKSNIYNKLMGLAGLGQSSASALANVGQNYSGQVSNNLAQGANAQAAGTVGKTNAINQGLGTVTNALGGYFMNRGSGYSGQFQPSSGVGGLGSGQGINGWW